MNLTYGKSCHRLTGMVEARHIIEDDEDDPRSDKRVGIRLAMAMGAAGMSPRDLEEAIGKAMSYETIRQTRLGQRSMRQMEFRLVANALGSFVAAEVGEDPLDWLQRGPSYNGGPTRPASVDNPRYLAPGHIAPVIPIEMGRKTHRATAAGG